MIDNNFSLNVDKVYFGSWVLTPSKQTLSDGDKTVELEPLIYKLLTFLIIHRDRIISRDEFR